MKKLMLVGLLLGAWAGAGDREWQEGKVLDSQMGERLAGMRGSSTETGQASLGTYRGQTTSRQQAVYRVWQTFLIEGKEEVYEVRQRLRWKWSKPASLAVNAPVRFALEKGKRKMVLVGEDGKEHGAEVMRRVRKK